MLSEDEKRGLKTPLCRTPVSDLLQFAAQFLPTTLYPSTMSDASLFGMHSMLALTASSADAPHGGPIETTDSKSAGSKPESEGAEKRDDAAPQDSQPSSVDLRPRLSSSGSDAITLSYPPMPATAQHVSVVQDRILRGSSVNEDLCSPIQADTVDVGHASETAVDPGMIVTGLTESTPDVFTDASASQEYPLGIGSRQTERVVETPRSVSQRRSRIVARFGLVQHSDYVPDSS